MWSDENHARIRFGAGSLNGIGDSVQGRSYCLVTYDEPIFHDNARRHGTPHGLAGADRLEEFLVNLGVSVYKADYGVDDGEWRKLIESAMTGERGRNFIGSQERVAESLGAGKW